MIGELLTQSVPESERHRRKRCSNDQIADSVGGDRAGFAEQYAPVVAGPGGIDA
jgi:hypothetical protein